ncbi:MAG TPA: SPFH domain-containing protein, partial [Methylomirabilota bacterium]|nr:SPFH domain-containing protein [Methylomirabilota bacterium]
VVVVAVLFLFASFIKIVPEYERVIIFRLGRRTRALVNPGGQGNGPGLVLLVPFIDRIVQRISLRTLAMDVPPQDVITRSYSGTTLMNEANRNRTATTTTSGTSQSVDIRRLPLHPSRP